MTEEQTLAYAKSYLKINYGGNWKLEISNAQYFWNDDIPLKEIIAKSDGGNEGYLLVSTSKQTPFLITKAFHGDTLTDLLLKKAGVTLGNITVTNNFVASLKFYYDPPFNFIIKNDAGLFIDVNDSFILKKTDVSFYLDVPEKNATEISEEWLRLEDDQVINPTSEIMHRSGPRYNQAYNSACVISGCSPVAWACYAGWLKMSGLLPTLFTNSDDWYNDWPSYIWNCDTAAEQSKAVHDLIWWFNGQMGTSNGSTLMKNLIKGGALFTNFGNPNIRVREFWDCSIQTVTSLLGNYAILFSGFRDWQTSAFQSKEMQLRYSLAAGHSVVCHGVRGNEIYVNMGWGEYVESRWYNINSITSRHCLGLYG